MDCSLQAPLSLGFSRQEYWSGLPCPPPGESSQPRDQTCISVSLLHWQVGSLALAPPGKPNVTSYHLTLIGAPTQCWLDWVVVNGNPKVKWRAKEAIVYLNNWFFWNDRKFLTLIPSILSCLLTVILFIWAVFSLLQSLWCWLCYSSVRSCSSFCIMHKLVNRHSGVFINRNFGTG